MAIAAQHLERTLGKVLSGRRRRGDDPHVDGHLAVVVARSHRPKSNVSMHTPPINFMTRKTSSK